MGIRKYHNQYRAAISVHGVMQQVYFDTQKQAEKYIAMMQTVVKRDKSPWSIMSKKRATAKHQDLPIGFYQHEIKRPLKNGGYCISQVISCVFMHNKKPITTRVNFGKCRTRSEAILLVTKKTLLKFELLNQK